MAVQASPAEIEAGALSTEKLRRLVEGFNTRGCTPPSPTPTTTLPRAPPVGPHADKTRRRPAP